MFRFEIPNVLHAKFMSQGWNRVLKISKFFEGFNANVSLEGYVVA